jgi:predicted nuclease of predicted toxin-antitoxin system
MMDEDVATVLRAKGCDVLRVGNIGLATAGDDEILTRAIADNRILVTLDGHFGDWVVLPLGQHPGVIRVKATPTTTAAVLTLLLPLLEAHAQTAFENRLVIVRKNGSRWVRTAT